MKSALWSAMALSVVTHAALAEESRHADAHEHGHGVFQMVIEEDHAVIELTVPAFDIIGFEHAPSTTAQRAAMADAATALSRPDVLFAVPSGAGCAIGQVEIGFGATGGHRHEHDGGDHDDHDDHEKHADEKHAHDDDDDEHDHDEHDHDEHDKHDADEEAHSEVTAFYRLACDNPGEIDRITFGYFDAFPAAEELEVVILSAAGQSTGEVSKAGSVFEIE